MRTGRLALVAVLLTLGVSAVALAVAQTGRVGPALGVTVNGHALHPVGRLTTVGDFPTGSALTPDGRFLWVADCGHGRNNVEVVSVASGEVLQTLPLPGCYGGIALAPDGRHAYVGGTPINSGDPTVDGPTKGNQGDVVHVFRVGGDGRAAELDPLALPSTSGGSGRQNSLPPVSGTGSAYPEGLAVSPDGTRLVVSLNQADKAVVIDLASGAQTLVSTGAYPDGVAFDHQGRAYVSNEYDGTLTVIDAASAKAVGTITGLGGARGDVNSHPEGIVADPLRPRLYVAVTNRDAVVTVDTAAQRVIGSVSVARDNTLGAAPVKLGVSPDATTLFAADSGEDAVAAISLGARPGPGAQVIPRIVLTPPGLSSIARFRRGRLAARHVLVQAHGSARRAAARRYRRALRRLRRRYLQTTRRTACAGPTARQVDVYVAGALRALSLHGRRARVRRARLLARARRALPAVRPCSAAPGYIPNLPAGQVIGKLPTAAYPDDVQVTPDGSQLLWIAGKGLGSGPNVQYSFDGDKRANQPPKNVYGTYVLDMLLGRVGTLPMPSDTEMRAATPTADAQGRPYDAVPRPADSPIPAAGTGPSPQIKHVFYIVRENRTYDQVFGTDPRGDGAPALELFDDNGVAGPTGGITPNAHKLARMFPLLDHFYSDSEVSVDGHIITAGAYATDYVQKALAANYSGRKRAFDFGIYPASFPPNDFVFDQAVRQGISFRDFGEAGAGNSPFGNDGRPTYSAVQANSDQSYPNNLFIGCLSQTGPVGTAANFAACTQDSGQYSGTGKPIAGKSRFNIWYPQFQQEVATGTVPTFTYLILPNDHTNGTTSGNYTPQALIADNDLALGQFVDAISHSSIWSSSAIFVVEDDSQDGADHVDSHRQPAFVISPWARKGAVVHTRYDQYSALRTAELLAGIDPLSLNDAEATPMYDAFTGSPDVDGTRYSVVAPTQDIGAVNGAAAPLARLSARLPWNRLDAVPQEISDQILWAAVHGAGSPAPPPGPNASPPEHARAVAVRAALASGGSARAALGGASDG